MLTVYITLHIYNNDYERNTDMEYNPQSTDIKNDSIHIAPYFPAIKVSEFTTFEPLSPTIDTSLIRSNVMMAIITVNKELKDMQKQYTNFTHIPINGHINSDTITHMYTMAVYKLAKATIVQQFISTDSNIDAVKRNTELGKTHDTLMRDYRRIINTITNTPAYTCALI